MPFLDPRLKQTEPQSESIELSYYKKKVNRLELEISKLKLEYSELENKFIRMKLGEKR